MFFNKKPKQEIHKITTISNLKPIFNIYTSEDNLHYILYKEKYSNSLSIYYFATKDLTSTYVSFVFLILKNPIETGDFDLKQYHFKNKLNEDCYVLELFNDSKINSDSGVVSLSDTSKIYEIIKLLKISESNDDDEFAQSIAIMFNTKTLAYNSLGFYKEIKPQEKEIKQKVETKTEAEAEEKDSYVSSEKEILPKPQEEDTNEEEEFSINKLKNDLKTETKILSFNNDEKSASFIGYKLDSSGEKYDISNLKPVKIFLNGKTALKQLSSHLLITGKSGSGKTSFNLSLINFLLRNDISVVAFDVKQQSIDYSSLIIKEAEQNKNLLSFIQMNPNEKLRGTLAEDDLIQKKSLKDNTKTLSGKEIVPLILWNKQAELGDRNSKYFTRINILGTDFLERYNSVNDEVEKKAIIVSFKDYLETTLTNYVSLINKHNKIQNSDVALKLVDEILSFYEKTNYKYDLTNKDFNKLFETSVNDVSDKVNEVYIKNLVESNRFQNYIDLDSGVNLYKEIKEILKQDKVFYLVLNIDSDLSAFYLFYIHYILSEQNLIKYAKLNSGLRFAVIIDEAEFLSTDERLIREIKIAEQVDRSKGISIILDSQQAFKKDFSAQTSIGNNILFSPQSSDLNSIKSKFSNIQNISKIIKTSFLFASDSDLLFVDENNNIVKDSIIRTIPNFVYSEGLANFGVDKYLTLALKYFLKQSSSKLSKFIPSTMFFGTAQIDNNELIKQILEIKKYISEIKKRKDDISDENSNINYIIGVLELFAKQQNDNKMLSELEVISSKTEIKEKVLNISKILQSSNLNIWTQHLNI